MARPPLAAIGHRFLVDVFGARPSWRARPVDL